MPRLKRESPRKALDRQPLFETTEACLRSLGSPFFRALATRAELPREFRGEWVRRAR